MRGLSATRIKTLVADQKARLALHHERWRALQLSTDRADRPTAEAGVRAAYRSAGLDPPHSIVWCGGPVELARDWNESRLRIDLGQNVRTVIVGQLRLRANIAVHDHLGAAIMKQVLAVDRTEVSDRIGRAVMGAVHFAANQASPGFIQTIRNLALGLPFRRIAVLLTLDFATSGYSQHEFGWLAAYEFLHTDLGLRQQTAALHGLLLLGANVGWIMPHEKVCWLAERHSVLSYDDRGRLHNGGGPALQYPDGWSVYAWKGITVPASLVEMSNDITVERICQEPDRVLRRCMIEVMTPERFVAAQGARCISQDDTGTLWLKVWPDGDAWAAVEVVNGTAEKDGTRSHYFLQVPSQLYTARAAVAWTYGLTEHEYSALIRRT